jgi:hypothetical protein
MKFYDNNESEGHEFHKTYRNSDKPTTLVTRLNVSPVSFETSASHGDSSGCCPDVDRFGCTPNFSSSPSLEGPAEVGGVDSAIDNDKVDGDGDDEEEEDDEEEGVAGSELNRSGEGGVLYDCRDPEARDSDSATVRGLAEPEGGSGRSSDVSSVRGRVVGEGLVLVIRSVVDSRVQGA